MAPAILAAQLNEIAGARDSNMISLCRAGGLPKTLSLRSALVCRHRRRQYQAAGCPLDRSRWPGLGHSAVGPWPYRSVDNIPAPGVPQGCGIDCAFGTNALRGMHLLLHAPCCFAENWVMLRPDGRAQEALQFNLICQRLPVPVPVLAPTGGSRQCARCLQWRANRTVGRRGRHRRS
jgi:hypothetical protein